MLPLDLQALQQMLPRGCSICGEISLSYNDVLWPDLINAWQLDSEEIRYINIQQGLTCTVCGGNLRSMTLARSISRSQGHEGTFRDWVVSESAALCRILEINEAGSLSCDLARLPNHVLVSYPTTDIHALKFDDDSFDLVIHSDTLEHVPNPVHALVECRRVLRQRGVLAFTVPVIVGRLSRSRAGLLPSYHGPSDTERADYTVETEFGADVWKYVLMAGFEGLTIQTDIFPASIAFFAYK